MAGVCAITVAFVASSAQAAAYTEIESFEGGVIHGVIKIQEVPSSPPPLHVTKDHGVCGKEVPDETYVVGKDRGLANVVVFLAGIKKGKKIGRVTVQIDNKKCRFVPHVSAFPQGTRLEILNSDATLHNIHSYLDGKTLFAAIKGYTYALNPKTGKELWRNSMSGFGYGVTSLCTTRGNTSNSLLGEADVQKRSKRRAAHSSHTNGD